MTVITTHTKQPTSFNLWQSSQPLVRQQSFLFFQTFKSQSALSHFVSDLALKLRIFYVMGQNTSKSWDM